MRSREMNGYIVYENGKIIGKKGKELKPYIHNGKAEVKINLTGGGTKHYTLTRLVYWVFNPEFDLGNKNLCVSSKTGNYVDFTLADLELKHRSELIQGENHKHCAKLTNHDVAQILEIYQGQSGQNQYDKIHPSQYDLAASYNVSRANISLITRQKGRNKEAYKLFLVG